MCIKLESEQLVSEIEIRCRTYCGLLTDVEGKLEAVRIRRELKQLCSDIIGGIRIEEPELLVALLDAYEITRDERMLQEVLDVVGRNLDRLEVSVEGVKLLSYCYYYVEEEECAEKARRMLDELRRKGNFEGVKEAEQVYRELIGEHI